MDDMVRQLIEQDARRAYEARGRLLEAADLAKDCASLSVQALDHISAASELLRVYEGDLRKRLREGE